MKTTQPAITSVHTFTMTDGTLIKTTWHDTKAEAKARITSESSASVRSVHPDNIFGAFRAVTWHK